MFIFYVILEMIVMVILAIIVLFPYYVVKETIRQVLYRQFQFQCYTNEELKIRKLPPIMEEGVAKIYRELQDDDLEVKEEYRIIIKKT